MADPSSPGPVGTPIPASGLAAHTSPSELASASAGTAVLAGAGITGDMIGTTITRSIITITTTPRAELSNRNTYYRGGGAHGVNNFNQPGGARGFNSSNGNVYNHPGASTKPFEGNNRAARGYAPPAGQMGVKSGAYSGYDHGGQTRSYSSRGNASLGGGGGFHGGGAPHGGGGGSHH